MITETIAGKLSRAIDSRLRAAKFVRSALNHVFPDHWSFMLGGGRALLVHDPGGHRNLSRLVLQGEFRQGYLSRVIPCAGRTEDLGRLPVRTAHQFGCSGRSAGSANAPLGSTHFYLGDFGAYGPDLSDGRLSQAARVELADRADFVSVGAGERVLRLFHARRSALGNGTAHRICDSALGAGVWPVADVSLHGRDDSQSSDASANVCLAHLSCSRADRRSAGASSLHDLASVAHQLSGPKTHQPHHRGVAAVAVLHGQIGGPASAGVRCDRRAGGAWPRSTRSGSTDRTTLRA